MFEIGDTETVEGIRARIYAVHDSGNYPIHGAVLIREEWMSEAWDEDGKTITGDTSKLDLGPSKIVRWVNIYKGHMFRYPTKKEAEDNALSSREACIRIEYVEGEGL